MTIWKMWEHKSWGDNISWMDVDKLTLSGHTTPIPEVGDELHCLMQSGRTGRAIFTEVKPCGDPPDMWFGKVEDAGYVEKVKP